MTNIFKYYIIQFIISIISLYKGCEVVLEKKAFDIICQLLEEFFKKYDYKMAKKDTSDSEVWQAVFVGKDKAYSVNWISSEKKYKLNIASVSDGVYDDFNNISVWLFDPDNNNESDAKSIAADFQETALGQISGKQQIRVTRDGKGATKKPSKLDYEEFCKKAIEIYPQYKDQYEANITHYGQLKPDEFVKDTLGVYMLEMLKLKKNAQLKKLFDLYDTGYSKGDNDVRSLVMVTLFGMLIGHEEEEQFAEKYMTDAMKPVWQRIKKILIKRSKKQDKR